MEEKGFFTTKAYAKHGPKDPLVPYTLERRLPGDEDVRFEVKYAGICHSDIHTGRDEWGPAIYPLVPGHELGGVVTAVGKNVRGFKVGDTVGVGCMVDSCRHCRYCRSGDEQYCAGGGMVGTYNSREKYPHCPGHVEGGDSRPTYGGYSQDMVVNYRFALHIPDNLDLAAATPLLCAGITVYSPMIYYGLNPHQKFAIAGLGGLAHVAVKFALAMGCHVTVISRGTKKKQHAIEELKAHAFIDSTNPEEMKAATGTIDFIIDTIACKHDLVSYMNLLAPSGKMILVGGVPEPMEVSSFGLLLGRKTLAGSLIGGVRETQDMLDFAGLHNITCDIELIKADYINEAWDRCVAADVKYRFVIDNSTM